MKLKSLWLDKVDRSLLLAPKCHLLLLITILTLRNLDNQPSGITCGGQIMLTRSICVRIDECLDRVKCIYFEIYMLDKRDNWTGY